MSAAVLWTPLTLADMAAVERIAREIHPTLPERMEVFSEKQLLFPEGCFKFLFEGKMKGYAIAHPWKLYSIPPLDEFLGELPLDVDCIYLHDVAVLSDARGHKAAEFFVEKITAVALERGIKHLSCVSVYGTDVLWSRFGFKNATFDGAEGKMEGYGESAKYMIADL